MYLLNERFGGSNMQIIRTIPAALAFGTAFTILWGVADPLAASAEVIEIEAEGRYPGGMQETPEQMQAQALEKAKQAAAEKVGVYVESHTETQNGVITKDNIRTWAASVLEITQRDFRMLPLADGKTIEMVCTIKARVDTDKIKSVDFADKEEQLQKINNQNQRIKELEAEAERLRSQIHTLSAAQQERAKEQLSENRRQSLMAIYEKNLDFYDLGQQPNMTELLETAAKLTELDPQNTTAFRAMMYYYRERREYQNAINYAERLLNHNPSPDLTIEACTQIGSIYTYELDERNKARTYVNRAIIQACQKYSQAEIDAYVNGSDVIVENFQLKGKTNTIRELYAMKSFLDNKNPSFVSYAIVKGDNLELDRIYNIKYPTDSTGYENNSSINANRKITETERLLLDKIFDQQNGAPIIDKEKGLIIAQGIGVGPKNSLSSVYKLYGIQAARLTALRSMTEVILGVHVASNTKENTITTKTEAPPALLDHAREIGTFYDEKGGCYIYMEIPLKYVEKYMQD